MFAPRWDIDSRGLDRYRELVTRGLGLAVGAALVAAGGLATSLAGCLEDLPQAATCPAPPVVEGSVYDCFNVIGDAVESGNYMFDPANLCLVEDPKFTECYRGPSGCDCKTEGECVGAGESEACFPAGDCPAKVLEQFPSARCVTLQPDDIGPSQQEPEQCLCGCEHCMSVCDGRGPVWSQLESVMADGGYVDPKGILFFDIRRHMPSRGKAGVYLRARGAALGGFAGGFGPPFLVVGPADVPPSESEPWALRFDLDDRFEDVVLPAEGEEVYTWGDTDTKPGFIGIYAGWNTVTLMEIDCIVPFVIE